MKIISGNYYASVALQKNIAKKSKILIIEKVEILDNKLSI